MKVAMVCPRRPDGGQRDVLFEFCRRWWAERVDWPLHVGLHLEGPFNRSAAINQAARDAGDWDVLVIVDGDVVAETPQVQAAVDRAAATGRMVLAFTEYCALDQQMTARVLAGYDGNWSGGARLRMRTHCSSIVVVPRALFELAGGFDERCEGWGSDDTIWAHVCRVLGGGIEHVPGQVWHLWHPTSPERAATAPGKVASAALACRYFAAHTGPEVQRIIAERAEPDGVCMVVLTHGRRECIDLSIDSMLAGLKGLPIVRTIICDDSANIDYQAWLRWRFPGVEVIGGKHGGFPGNMRRAWDAALASGQRWVFWLEDDFVLQRPVDLGAIAAVMTRHPELSQVVLRRQAWYPAELAAGGIIEADPDAHTDVRDGDDQWVEHGLGHWTNPHLVARSFLAAHTWPTGIGSEAKFAKQIRGKWRSAYWGPRSDPPIVEHMGERNGDGY